jgi:hypothetical protein
MHSKGIQLSTNRTCNLDYVTSVSNQSSSNISSTSLPSVPIAPDLASLHCFPIVISSGSWQLNFQNFFQQRHPARNANPKFGSQPEDIPCQLGSKLQWPAAQNAASLGALSYNPIETFLIPQPTKGRFQCFPYRVCIHSMASVGSTPVWLTQHH